MNTKSTLWAGLIVLILLIAAGAYAYLHLTSMSSTMATTTTPAIIGSSTQYTCAQGTLTAAFVTGQVTLTFPDGHTLLLPQMISGSGFRYGTGATVFSGKGSSAMLTENNVITYANCIAGTNTSVNAGDTNAGMKTFTDSSGTFRFMYPGMFSLTGSDAGYTNDWSSGSAQLGLVLAQVTIPQSFQPKTNFADARFTVGTSADAAAVKDCLTETNGSTSQKPVPVTINGVPYTKLTYGDAGAGNFYETTSYRTVRNNQCYAIEYTIHSANIGNFSPDQGITAFDHAKVQGALEDIVQSFRFL
ncbi:MAG TPA: MliC family protein [Candidatus Paceibacterota bacterium]|jgi:membrane-bound inhibitor of C-type lysozyme|nr:MliC family protein [Candidatus Paceibacterota bacterium]